MWHSCSNYTLEHHFERSDPKVRAIFDRFIEVREAYAMGMRHHLNREWGVTPS